VAGARGSAPAAAVDRVTRCRVPCQPVVLALVLGSCHRGMRWWSCVVLCLLYRSCGYAGVHALLLVSRTRWLEATTVT
jgi:hypothetical protein